MDELNHEIQKKINGWKRTRYNRINISERLKKYSAHWNNIMFFMNAFAIILTITSLKFPLNNEIDTVITGCFSIYVILLQYFLANQNYEKRSLKFHYEQLEIEKLRYSLKKLLRDSSLSYQQKQEKYISISNQYLISLKNNENHEKLDDKAVKDELDKSKEKSNNASSSKNKSFHDKSLDNIFFYLNLVLFVGVVFFVISSYF